MKHLELPHLWLGIILSLSPTISAHADSCSVLSETLSQMKFLLTDQIRLQEIDLKWPELENFELELYRVSALDPTEFVPAFVPKENLSSHLTESLQLAWGHVKSSASRRLTDSKSKSFQTLSQEVNNLLQSRSESHFQSARMRLKSGIIQKSIELVKQEYSDQWKQTHYTLSVTRNADHPELPTLIHDAEIQIQKLNQIIATREPAATKEMDHQKPKPTSMFWGLLLFSFGIIVSTLFHRSRALTPEPSVTGPVLDYAQWLKDFERTLTGLGLSRTSLQESRQNALESIERLREARVGLQLATNETEYHQNLSKLNASAPALEDFVIESNRNRDLEPAQEVIKQVLELTDAIEQNKPIHLNNFSRVRASRIE